MTSRTSATSRKIPPNAGTCRNQRPRRLAAATTPTSVSPFRCRRRPRRRPRRRRRFGFLTLPERDRSHRSILSPLDPPLALGRRRVRPRAQHVLTDSFAPTHGRPRFRLAIVAPSPVRSRRTATALDPLHRRRPALSAIRPQLGAFDPGIATTRPSPRSRSRNRALSRLRPRHRRRRGALDRVGSPDRDLPITITVSRARVPRERAAKIPGVLRPPARAFPAPVPARACGARREIPLRAATRAQSGPVSWAA